MPIAAKNLKLLATVRVLIILAEIALFAYVAYALGLAFDAAIYRFIWPLQCLITAVSIYRARRVWPMQPVEFAAHLLFDVILLAWLVYLTGGIANPFVSLLLVPLVISAAVLPWRYTAAFALITVLFYTLLFYYGSPLMAHAGHGSHSHLVDFHLLGMWLSFTFSAFLICVFVVRMGETVREQRALIEAQTARALQDEKLIALAVSSAHAAHHLSTPLATMAVILSDMQEQLSADSPWADDLTTLQTQVQSCKQALQNMVQQTDNDRQGLRQRMQVGDYLKRLEENWRLLNPQHRVQISAAPETASYLVEISASLDQAIMNLLNNAVQAGSRVIEMHAGINAYQVVITISDDGHGIDNALKQVLGERIVTSHKGLGMGYYLTHATISRLGGRLTLFENKPEGTVSQIELPAYG